MHPQEDAMVTMWDPPPQFRGTEGGEVGDGQGRSRKYQQYQKGSWRAKTQVSLVQFYVHPQAGLSGAHCSPLLELSLPHYTGLHWRKRKRALVTYRVNTALRVQRREFALEKSRNASQGR